MLVTKLDDGVRIDLTAAEVRLLRRALERASFIDTPVSEQPAILSFCARALETLPQPHEGM
jgi:hypothetical protein